MHPYASEYALVAVCRGVTRGVPFWDDEFLFRSREYPISDGDIEVIVGSPAADRICSSEEHLFECMAVFVSKEDGKVLPTNPGLRTAAGCKQNLSLR